MAGIGFELRKLMRKGTYAGLFRAYAYAGVVSAGPWVLSIVAILVIGVMSLAVVSPEVLITQFQVSVTFLLVSSIIFTGPVQLAFTRWVADRLFEKKDALVMPNFMGLLLCVMAAAGTTGIVLLFALFGGLSDMYRVLMLSGFVILCCVWTTTIFLSGMKRYRAIVSLFALGYSITVAAALALRPLGTEGLLFGFVIGHFVLLTGMVTLVIREFPAPRLVAFDFARRGAMFPALAASGLLYHLGIWADKFIFWYSPETGSRVIGPLHASVIYDMPVFLAYLAIIPGMAVFLVRIETDFAEYFEKFYEAVRAGSSIDFIEGMREEMVFTIRQALAEIVKIQGMAVLVVFATGAWVLARLGISELYLPLLYINVVSAGLQVVLLGILTVCYYLDKRAAVVGLTALLVTANVALTLATLALGAPWYGYGFAAALLVTVVAGVRVLESKLGRLEYETFMLQ
ncbi:MAG: exopolysaccharide Pel transporter PelG [Burkholderiales bacterium]|nr:exopolysaccharide Pel transporter PelG [Burkholderiales bacterium]